MEKGKLSLLLHNVFTGLADILNSSVPPPDSSSCDNHDLLWSFPFNSVFDKYSIVLAPSELMFS